MKKDTVPKLGLGVIVLLMTFVFMAATATGYLITKYIVFFSS